MILTKYKALFIHIPKAAGQTIENFLLKSLNCTRELNGNDFLLKKNENPKLGPERLAHLTAKEYIQLNYLSINEFNEYYKFSFVRNPWSRMVSFYKFMGYSRFISFPVFIKQYLPYCLEKQNWFFKPQTEFIFDDNDQLLIDFVGKLENLNNDFSIIADQLNLEFKKLPKNNSSTKQNFLSQKSLKLVKQHPSLVKYLLKQNKTHSTYQEYYDKESKKIVDKYYAKDIDLLDYQF
ncbi:MAG: sulfotransferase family 2 domain-containing protein [Flavobacteriales bacterium]